jgi:hypothetical protein
MRLRPWLARLACTAALAGVWLAPAPARADGLSPAETSRLMSGEAVSRAQRLELGQRRYVGGVTYQIVDAPPQMLERVFDDVSTWRRFLPKAREASVVGRSGGDALVAITHGSSLIQVGYTLRVHRDADQIRFWMDGDRPHDIDDAWGYMRATPLGDGRTLLSWGILVDMGPGLLRDLFEDQMQAQALRVPEGVRHVVTQFVARGARASR